MSKRPITIVASIFAIVAILGCGWIPNPTATPGPIVATNQTLQRDSLQPPTPTTTGDWTLLQSPTQQPPAAPAQPYPRSPLGTGIPVPSGQKLTNGNAYIIRDTIWSGNTAEVWVFSMTSFSGDSRGNATGPAWDNVSTTHVRDAWTSSTGEPWQSMPLEVCKEAQAVVKGSLGTTNVVVHIPDGNGGWITPPSVCQ